jgi:hypothetical protein
MGEEKNIELYVKEGETSIRTTKRKIIIIIALIFIILMLLAYFFFFQYNSGKDKMEGIFSRFYDYSKEEFGSDSYSDLIEACDEKEVGDSCSFLLKGEAKEGVCSLSEEDNLICMINS